MPECSLKRLRKAAGFATGKAFAESIGIPAPTYARYEQSEDGPETNVPMKAAFTIADALGCSIDAVVGRGEIPAAGMRGDVQRRFDALSDDGKQLVIDFMEMAEKREGRAEARRIEELAARHAAQERRLELAFLESLAPEDDSGILEIGGEDELRNLFAAFAASRLEGEEASRVEREVEAARTLARQRGWASRPGDGNGIDAGQPGFEELVEENAAEYRRRLEGKSAERVEGVMEGIMAAYDKAHPATGGNSVYAVVDLS